MAVYLVMLTISIFFASLAGRIRGIQEYKRTFCVCAVLSFVPFLVVSAIRYEVGTDWIVYDAFFTRINEGTEYFKEPLFNLLNKLLYLFTQDSQWIFVVSAVLSLSFTFLAIYKQSMYIPFSILLFFLSTVYFNSLNQVRQAIAMSIFLFASQYIWKRDWKKYLLWILLATGMHLSALIYVPIYFIYGWKAEIKKHLLLFAAVAVSMPVIKVVLIKVISLTPYAWYFDSMHTGNDFMLSSFIMSLLLLLLYEYYNYIGNREDDKQFHFMVNMQWLCVVSTLCTSFIPQFSRISGAFEIMIILSIPKMILYEKNRNQRIIVYCLVVALLAVELIYNVYICGFYDVIPYETIFSR